MNPFMFVIFYLLIVFIHADFIITQQSPKTNIFPNTNQFSFGINQTVNRPSFQSFIRINNATNNATIFQIDVHINTTNITYGNNNLTFYFSIKWNINDEFYITFETGVLFSNNQSNSTAQTNPNFWHLKVIDYETTSSMTTILGITSMETTYTAMASSATSAFITSTISTTHTSTNGTTTLTTAKLNRGEPPPTRSAKLGMGLGITFISVIIIGEIIYFKYCYKDIKRRNNRHHMVLLFAAGVATAAGAAGLAGLAGYALGKRRERRQVANGYMTYPGNTQNGQYGHLHYGHTGRPYRRNGY